MIRLHHCHQTRSMRSLWLLNELLHREALCELALLHQEAVQHCEVLRHILVGEI